MAQYFIFAFEYDGEFKSEHMKSVHPSSLVIDLEDYRAKLTRHWMEAVHFLPSTIVSSLRWEFELSESRMVKGPYAIGNDMQTLSMDVPDVEFCLWHRLMIPGATRLFVTGEDSSKAMELTLQTTARQLAKVFC